MYLTPLWINVPDPVLALIRVDSIFCAPTLMAFAATCLVAAVAKSTRWTRGEHRNEKTADLDKGIGFDPAKEVGIQVSTGPLLVAGDVSVTADKGFISAIDMRDAVRNSGPQHDSDGPSEEKGESVRPNSP